jgi:thioredoxin 1
LAKAVSLTAVVGKVDVQKEGELASRYGISGIPALLVFSHGQVVKQFTGLTSAGDLQEALDAAGGLQPKMRSLFREEAPL